MKTLTVRLPETLAREIEAESKERNVTKSDVIRERLEFRDRASGKTNGSTLENILEASWSAKAPTFPPGFKSSKKQKLAELIRAKKLHR